jgi:hypothetical protein
MKGAGLDQPNPHPMFSNSLGWLCLEIIHTE